MPVTGIPLPFMSHGGSSLFSSFALLGMVVAAARFAAQPRAVPLPEPDPPTRSRRASRPSRSGTPRTAGARRYDPAPYAGRRRPLLDPGSARPHPAQRRGADRSRRRADQAQGRSRLRAIVGAIRGIEAAALGRIAFDETGFRRSAEQGDAQEPLRGRGGPGVDPRREDGRRDEARRREARLRDRRALRVVLGISAGDESTSTAIFKILIAVKTRNSIRPLAASARASAASASRRASHRRGGRPAPARPPT